MNLNYNPCKVFEFEFSSSLLLFFFSSPACKGMTSSHNKLHKIFSKLNDCISCPGTDRREKIVLSRLDAAYPLLWLTHSFLLKREHSHLYELHMWRVILIIEHILLCVCVCVCVCVFVCVCVNNVCFSVDVCVCVCVRVLILYQ